MSPESCVVAPENEEIEEFEVCQLLVGRYRVLFTVRERRVFARAARRSSSTRAARRGRGYRHGGMLRYLLRRRITAKSG